MSKFDDLAKKAESFAEEHPQEADKAIQEAGDLANRETGGKYQSEVQEATGAAERRFGQGSGQGQGSQDHNGYQQDQGGGHDQDSGDQSQY